MTVENTESPANSSNQTRSAFHCQGSPEFIWDLNHTISFKIIVTITTIACPVTILLNLLMIMAVKTRRELKKKSNILLSSVALADLLVGSVSMPLSITFDTLVIKRVLVVDIICSIAFISVSAMYTICSASFFHVLLIAWERYVAVGKWMEYNATVTTGRVNKYTKIAWLSAVLMEVPLVIMVAVGVPFQIVLVVDVILTIFWFVCLSLIAYFYVKAYLAVRKWNRTRIRPVNVLLKGKLESKVAYTTFWLTVFIAVSTAPILLVYPLRGVWPFFRQISTIRWAETILQLNSLFNPLLYWYRNRRLRQATLELLRCRNRPAARDRTARHIKRRRYSVVSLDVEKVQNEQKGAQFVRSDNFTQQRNELNVTVHIENAPGGKGVQGKIELPKKRPEAWKISPSYRW